MSDYGHLAPEAHPHVLPELGHPRFQLAQAFGERWRGGAQVPLPGRRGASLLDPQVGQVPFLPGSEIELPETDVDLDRQALRLADLRGGFDRTQPVARVHG